MVDQWWQFYYAIYPAYDRQKLSEQGCDYVPLPITMQEGVENQWHVERAASIDTSSGLSVTVSCEDIDGALQFFKAGGGDSAFLGAGRNGLLRG